MNLAHLLATAAERFPDRIGLACGDRVWLWRDMEQRVSALCMALVKAGVSKGEAILVHTRNNVQMVEAMLACFRIGAVWIPTNFRQAPEDTAYQAEVGKITAALCEADFPDHAAAVRAARPDLRLMVSIGEADFGESYEKLVAAHSGAIIADTDVDRDDPCWYFFTSGTTGKPKAAVLTHGQLGSVIINQLCDLMQGMTPQEDASIVVAPLSHAAGIHFLVQVARGVKSILPESATLDPEEVWRLVTHWRITNLFAVPTIIKTLVEHPAVDRHDHGSLKQVVYAGSPMYREDQKRALVKLGKVLVQFYGLGEVTCTITVLPADAHDVDDERMPTGSCGYERTGMRVVIQDADGRDLPTGETGEICVCGHAVFAGYLDDPQANAKAFRNGWFRTGDLGHRDDAGFLYITGRLSDMYISGGSNVYPREIEEKILLHPAVREVAVIGLPDPRWGEVGLALIVLEEGASVDEPALRSWMEARMARYKIPKTIRIVTQIPKTAIGKVSKKEIRERLMAEIAKVAAPIEAVDRRQGNGCPLDEDMVLE